MHKLFHLLCKEAVPTFLELNTAQENDGLKQHLSDIKVAIDASFEATEPDSSVPLLFKTTGQYKSPFQMGRKTVKHSFDNLRADCPPSEVVGAAWDLNVGC